MWFLRRGRKPRLRASVLRLDEPTGLSLSMVASPQCRFRFARQNYCRAAAASAANFRIRRDPTTIQRFAGFAETSKDQKRSQYPDIQCLTSGNSKNIVY